jgi:diaminohydroxyphosphoribosylaminopyrimidine deaminase/5-amino-6-(5-phosphoribosylamino)uracil reductase
MDEEVKPGQVLSPAQAMRLAIREGAKGAGFVAPNPLVGCTILDREHRLLAIGYHKRVGHDHAEIDAVKQISDPSKLEGAHVFVTLEPCAHQGRTPSCARTLAPMKIASLTYAVEDPNPLVAGKGAAIMREVGVKTALITERSDISVEEARTLAAEAEELAEIFLHNMRAKEPFVAIKIASTLDGKMALASGESKWITNEASREYVQLLRARYGAVAIGRTTFVADDPSLNVRHANYPSFENNVVLFDPKGQTLPSLAQSKLLQVRGPERVFVVVDRALKLENPLGVQLVPVPLESGRFFDVGSVLAALRDQGLTSIMIEGGAQTAGVFFKAKKVQRLHLFQAPKLIGGLHGISWSAGFGVEKMADGFALERVERREFTGPIAGEVSADFYVTGRVRYEKNPAADSP